MRTWILCALLVGCGGNTLDQNSSIKVTASALKSTSQATARLQQMMSQAGNVLSVTLDNPAGGSASLQATVSKVGNSGEMHYTMTFNQWQDADLESTIDGSVTVDEIISSFDPLSLTLHYSGQLSVSGKINGEASIVLDVSFQNGSWSICGTASGHPVGNAC
jgi:hypothetical protein